MKSCCVVGCSGPTTPNPVFFEFPSSRLLRKRWLDAIKCPDATEDATVCIRHFSRADYQVVRGTATLRSRSVPSRRIGESDDDDSESGSESSESSSSDESQDKNDDKNSKNNEKNNIDNGEINDDNGKTNDDNGKINNDTGKINNDTGKINDDNGKINDDNDKINIDNRNNEMDVQIENGPIDAYNNCNDNADTENNDNRLNNEDNGQNNNDNGKNDINGQTNDENRTNNSNTEMNRGSSKLKFSYGKLDFDFGTIKTTDTEKSKDSDKINDDSEITKDDNGKNNDDNGKNNNDSGNNNKIQGKKTRCKITAMRAINGKRKASFSSDSTNSDSVTNSPRREIEGNKVDIEESLQHYYIENKKTERQVAAMADVLHTDPQQEQRSVENGVFEPTDPVFIELSVGQGATVEGQEPTESDCLMVLESVQCDVDPTLLLAAREEEEENMEQVELEDDDDDDEPVFVEKKKEDPISLLTSSDEDDVIIQEPKYDLVEVSSADTSEDDMPLVKLVKPSSRPSSQKKAKLSAKHTKKLITKLLWGKNDFYCVHCKFTTADVAEYTRHMATHNFNQTQHKIIQYCPECGFTTSSKHQMQKHKQKHKNEKRYKCPKCNYSAKHEMSLVYHMKTHKNTGVNEVELAICGTYEPPQKSGISGKSGTSKRGKIGEKRVSEGDKRYKCKSCKYRTDRRSDLIRHKKRIHGDDDDDDDDEYVP